VGDTAERRPGKGGVQDDAGSNVETSLPPDPGIDPDELAKQLRRRREASRRLPPMPCGHRDPLDCPRAAS
jgi:hypothetical protein